MSTEDNHGKIAAYLKENPRAMGVLFTLVLLLAQATPVVASNTSTTTGP